MPAGRLSLAKQARRRPCVNRMHMRKKPSLLSVVVFGMVLSALLPATTLPQDKFNRSQEPPQVVIRHSPQAIVAVFATTVSTDVGVGIAESVNLRSADDEVLTPMGNADSGSADPLEESDRTELLVTLAEPPPDLLSPSLVAEIHQGSCLDLKSDSVRPAEDSEVA